MKTIIYFIAGVLMIPVMTFLFYVGLSSDSVFPRSDPAAKEIERRPVSEARDETPAPSARPFDRREWQLQIERGRPPESRIAPAPERKADGLYHSHLEYTASGLRYVDD
jgi:hypothetical protein